MTAAHSLNLAELRQRYPRLRVVERAADSEEFNRQRYLLRLDSNRMFLTAAVAFPVAAACAIAAYHFATQAGGSVSSYYLVRSVTCFVWGIWSAYCIIAGFISGSYFVPHAADAYVGTRVDPDLAPLPFPVVILLSLLFLAIIWFIVLSFPMNSDGSGIYIITKSDDEKSSAVKLFIYLSMLFVGTVMLATGGLAYVRYLIKDWREKNR